MREFIDTLMDTYYPEKSVLEFPLSNNNNMDIIGYNRNGDVITYNNKIKINRDDIFPMRSISEDFTGDILDYLYFGLHRENYINHQMFPASLIGTSSNFIAECIRMYSKCQIGMIRGYRNNMCIESGNNLSYNKKSKY